MEIKVPVTATGFGSEKNETIIISEEEIRQLACDKLRENDVSSNIYSLGELELKI